MIKSRFGSELDGWVHALFPFLFRRSLNPNALTAWGTGVSMAAAVALGSGHLVLGGLLVLAGGFFDLVDGVVARHTGSASSFGAFFDSTMDRLVDMALLLGVMVYLAGQGDILGVVLAGTAMIGGVLTSYIKARAESFLPSLEGGFFERAERVLVLALGVLTGWLGVALWILALGSVYTAGVRFVAARRALEREGPASLGPAGEEG